MHKLKLFQINNKILFKIQCFKFSKKINEKEQINKEQVRKYSYSVLNNLMLEIEPLIESNVYKIRSQVFPNNFSNIPLYLTSVTTPMQYLVSNIELKGVLTISLITFLNYYMVIFPSMYLFTYLMLINLNCFSKLYWKTKYLETIIYEINLISNKEVKVTYINGNSQIVNIQDITLTNKSKEALKMSIEKKPILLAQNIPLEIRINGSKDAYIILNENTGSGCIVNLEPLMAILHKKTKMILF